MTHIEAVTVSTFDFAIRHNMLYGGKEQFLISDGRYYRLQVENAQTFSDWEPLAEKGPLELLRKNYPYIVIPTQEQLTIQGQVREKKHGRKQKV